VITASTALMIALLDLSSASEVTRRPSDDRGTATILERPKKPVNMTLSEELVREARGLTGNLSETVERLLAEFVAAERRKRDEKERRIDATIAMLNDLYDRHGGLGEEFSPL
jgi:antitoxin CcdA